MFLAPTLEKPKENRGFRLWGPIPGTGSQGKSGQAGSGTLTHPNRDKNVTKWVAIKDFGAFSAGFYAEFRRESFSRGVPTPISQFFNH